MAYPSSIDGFRTVVEDDKLLVGDQNNMGDALTIVEETLGTNPQGSESNVKDRLVAIEVNSDAVPDKLDKAGGSMTGTLTMTTDGATASKEIRFDTDTDINKNKIFVTGSRLQLDTNFGVKIRDGAVTGAIIDSSGIDTDGNVESKGTIIGNTINARTTPEVSLLAGLSMSGLSEYIHTIAGKGLVLKTPDGTKNYRISIDNSGNVITTLIP